MIFDLFCVQDDERYHDIVIPYETPGEEISPNLDASTNLEKE